MCRNATLYFMLNGCAGNVASYSQIVVKFPSFTRLKLSVLCIQKPATVPYSGPSKSTLHHCNLFHDNPFNTVRVSVVLSVLRVFPSSSSLIYSPQHLLFLGVCSLFLNPLNPELNPICYLLALLGAHHFLHVSRIRVKLLTLRLLMSYIYIYIWSTHS